MADPRGAPSRSSETRGDGRSRAPRASPRPGPQPPGAGVSERQAALPLPRRRASLQSRRNPVRLSLVRPGQAQAAGGDCHTVFYLGTFQETPVTWPSTWYRLSSLSERAFVLLLSHQIAGIVLWQRGPQMSVRRSRPCMPRREG